jgi:hypothetical protein
MSVVESKQINSVAINTGTISIVFAILGPRGVGVALYSRMAGSARKHFNVSLDR